MPLGFASGRVEQISSSYWGTGDATLWSVYLEIVVNKFLLKIIKGEDTDKGFKVFSMVIGIADCNV